MALPTTNISTTLVGETLGVSTRDVGGLCTSTAVNQWSKWKPVRFNTVNPLTQAQLEAVNYGIGWNIYSNIEAVISAYQNSENPVFYNKPRGGLYDEPYRLGDFRGYEHSAIQPIAGGFVSQQAQNIEGGQTSITGSVFINGNPKTGEIGWDDLGMGNRKLAMALYSGNSLVKTAIADNVGDTFVVMDTRSPLPVLSAGTYNAYLFFTSNAGTTTNGLRGLPNHSRFGFLVSVVSKTVFVSVRARWDVINNPNQILITVEGINQTGSTVSLLNCNLRVRNNDNICTSTIQDGERVVNVPSTLSLPPTTGIPETLYSTSVIVNRDMYPAWKICWSNTGAHPNTFEANIIDKM